MIYSKGPDRDKKLIIDKSFSIDHCDCDFNCKTTYADDSVLFNTFWISHRKGVASKEVSQFSLILANTLRMKNYIETI